MLLDGGDIWGVLESGGAAEHSAAVGCQSLWKLFQYFNSSHIRSS